MRRTALWVLALLLGATYATESFRKVAPGQACRVKSKVPIEGKVKAALTPVKDLPANWLWSDVNGTNYLTNMRN